MTGRTVTIVGSYLSPYVRKVLVCLDVKGIPYRIDPIVPFFGDDEFSKLSPVRRIPVLIDDDVTLCDSTVICEYLEDRVPDPPLFPKTAAERARARWLEEFADTRMGEVFIWRLYNQLVINRFVWGEQPDPAIVGKALTEEIPSILDYLEVEVPSDGFSFGDRIAVADVAIGTFFRNAAFAKFAIDEARWPKAAGFVRRVLAHPSFAKLMPFEDLSMRTPIPKIREALASIGAPIAEMTFATAKPRRGILQI